MGRAARSSIGLARFSGTGSGIGPALNSSEIETDSKFCLMLPSSELELEMILMKLFWTTQEDVPEFLYKQSFILIKRRTFKELILFYSVPFKENYNQV